MTCYFGSCLGERKSCFLSAVISIPMPAWQNAVVHKYYRVGVALLFTPSEEKHWSNLAYLYKWFIIPFYFLTRGLMIEVRVCLTIGEINIYATWLFYHTKRILSINVTLTLLRIRNFRYPWAFFLKEFFY